MELMSVEEKEYEIACEQVLHTVSSFSLHYNLLDLLKIMLTIFFLYFLNQINSKQKSSFYGILYLLFKGYINTVFFCFPFLMGF